ncbi:Serine/threonine-protein kinase CTR1 [Hordeum vulgare]|nr:Serine/threonine-protein kinase CTR1 [Hordeum vulgare]
MHTRIASLSAAAHAIASCASVVAMSGVRRASATLTLSFARRAHHSRYHSYSGGRVMGNGIFEGSQEDWDDPSPKDSTARCADIMDLCQTGPTIDRSLCSREEGSAMRMTIASSNPHETTSKLTNPDWSESDPLPSMLEIAGRELGR